MRSLNAIGACVALATRDGLLLLLLACTTLLAAAQDRQALVIGNARYQHVEPLRNPLNDAELIAASLSKVGFKVTLLLDATLEQMVQATTEFGRGLKRGDIAFAYFAGHGVQYGGENYLVPVDADVERPDQLGQRTFPTSRLFAALPADGRTSNIVVLDACRNNPFADRSPAYARALNAAGSQARAMVPAGLSQVDNVPGNTLIAYATSPGKVALDGKGRNSPYAEALAKVMQGEGLEVTALFQEATLLVKESTRFEQEPWMNWSLNDKVFFKKRKSNNVIF
jgi:uncharacterized caspase-like protein